MLPSSSLSGVSSRDQGFMHSTHARAKSELTTQIIQEQFGNWLIV